MLNHSVRIPCLVISILAIFSFCSKEDNPATVQDIHTRIGVWWLCGYTQILAGTREDITFSETDIRGIIRISADSLISYYVYTDSTYQRNRFSYVCSADTIALNEEQYEKNWIIAFVGDTLTMSLLGLDADDSFAQHLLPYTGPVPPTYWGTFDPNSEHP